MKQKLTGKGHNLAKKYKIFVDDQNVILSN